MYVIKNPQTALETNSSELSGRAKNGVTTPAINQPTAILAKKVATTFRWSKFKSGIKPGNR